MSYANDRYAARPFVHAAYADLGTATASATDGANVTPAVKFPTFPRRTQINSVRFAVNVIPDSGSTALKAHLKNGTNTFAVVTLTTATAGQVLDATMTAANAIFAADTGPSMVVTGTATASADANGIYNISWEQQELFA